MRKEIQDSTVRLTLNLPRIVLKGKTKAHVLISGENIGQWHRGEAYLVDLTACHAGDIQSPGEAIRWATPEDETCRTCLKYLRFLNVEVT